MLDARTQYTSVSRLVSSILRLPKSSRQLLFHWLRMMPSEYFCRWINVLQNFIALAATDESLGIDMSSSVLILAEMYKINQVEEIAPPFLFYNPALSDSQRLPEDYEQWLRAGHYNGGNSSSSVFSVVKFPWLLDATAKRKLLQIDATRTMSASVSASVNRYLASIK